MSALRNFRKTKGIGKVKIVIACGGTGGHSFPGIAVAEELVLTGHEVTVWASGRAVESSVMKRWTGPLYNTGARQLSIKNIFSILHSTLRCCRRMRKEKPDALLAMGSYASLPPVIAARICHIPVFLHEANTVPGKAVEFLARFADKVAISFEITSKYLEGVNTELTGLPVRKDISEGIRFDFIPKNAFVVFVTGGSQGAHAVNELMTEALVIMQKALRRRGRVERPLYVIHQTGVMDEPATIAAYAAASLPARVHAFEREMANAFKSADIVIARAGASTCFELAACAKPALLIPLPTSMRNHQHFNAEAFVACGAADEGMQGKLDAKAICRYLMDRYDHPEKLVAMSERMAKLATPDAAKHVAKLLTTCIK